MCRMNQTLFCIHQKEAPGSIRIFHITCIKAGLSKQGCLLIPDQSRNGYRMIKHTTGYPVYLAGITDFRKHTARDIPKLQQHLIILQCFQIHEHRSGSIGDICHMLCAFGQLPQQPGIHRSKQQLTAFCTLLRTLYMIQYPTNLAGREIRIQKQSGLFTNHCLLSFLLQLLAIIICLPGLPDDGKINRLTAFLIPDNRSLSLIGNTDSRHLCILHTGFCQYLKHNTDGAGPYIICILFHPARVRIKIFQLLLRYAYNIAGFIKQNGAGTCRSLINRHDIGCHICFLLHYFSTL